MPARGFFWVVAYHVFVSALLVTRSDFHLGGRHQAELGARTASSHREVVIAATSDESRRPRDSANSSLFLLYFGDLRFYRFVPGCCFCNIFLLPGTVSPAHNATCGFVALPGAALMAESSSSNVAPSQAAIQGPGSF